MKTQSNWLTFTLVAIAQFMVVLDTAITNVALPIIKEELQFTTESLQWVITAYALAFGGFLLLGGRAADLFGRRRVLLGGMAAFTIFSFLIGISNSAVMLIVLRALQGLSAAFMSPAALSIVLVTFRDGADRNRALAYWTLVATGGAAVGLLLGGILTQYLGWRWNFFINVPIGLIMSFIIYRFVPAHADEEKQSGLDVPGALLITSGLMSLVFATTQATVWGWLDVRTLGIFALAASLIAGFIFNESRAKHPLMPLSIFSIRNVTGANLIMIPVYATMLGSFFIFTLYIQTILRFSPVIAGLSFLPFPFMLGFISTRMPRLVARFGYRRFLIAGPLTIALALLWLSRVPLDGNYFFDLLPAFLLMPIGVGMTMMPTIVAATSGVPSHEAGLASGLITTSQQMGGAFGLSILSSVAASVALSQGQSALAALTGYHAAVFTAIGFVAIAAAVATFVIRETKTASHPARHAASMAAGH